MSHDELGESKDCTVQSWRNVECWIGFDRMVGMEVGRGNWDLVVFLGFCKKTTVLFEC
jgi:hypothetical protein